MIDIFISYKREEQQTAMKVAEALERHGWSVWWDPHLHAGEHFDDAIQRALQEARCVIVLWSKRSVESRYIRDEATYALNNDKLVPIAIEDVDLPFRFASLQTAQLFNWDGSDASTEFRRIVSDITAKISGPPAKGNGISSAGDRESKPLTGGKTGKEKDHPEISSPEPRTRTKAAWFSNFIAIAVLAFFYLVSIENACANHDMLALSALVGFPVSIFLIFQRKTYRIVWLLAPALSFFIGMPYGHNYGTMTKSPLFGLDQGTDCQPDSTVAVILVIVAIIAITDHAIFLRSSKRK